MWRRRLKSLGQTGKPKGSWQCQTISPKCLRALKPISPPERHTSRQKGRAAERSWSRSWKVGSSSGRSLQITTKCDHRRGAGAEEGQISPAKLSFSFAHKPCLAVAALEGTGSNRQSCPGAPNWCPCRKEVVLSSKARVQKQAEWNWRAGDSPLMRRDQRHPCSRGACGPTVPVAEEETKYGSGSSPQFVIGSRKRKLCTTEQQKYFAGNCNQL